MKWFLYVVLALALVFGWFKFMTSQDDEIAELQAQIVQIEDQGSIDEQEELPKLRDRVTSLENETSLTGIMLAFLTAGLVGVVFVVDILPLLAHRFTHAVYDSGEEVEEDVMHDARAKLAQGEYEDAISAFRDAAAKDPTNRIPWVEIAKVQREHLSDPAGAVATLREAIEQHDWQVNDAAYLMFRLAETYDEALGDRTSAVAIMQQVVDQFPETRHSANAKHRLQEWGTA